MARHPIQQFEDAYRISTTSLIPNGELTLHQRALLILWVSVACLWLFRKASKILLPKIYSGYFNLSDEGQDHNRIEDGHKRELNHNVSVEEKIHVPANAKKENELVRPAPCLDTILYCLFLYGLVLYYFYLCDYTHRFLAAERTYSRDLFLSVLVILLLVGCAFTSRPTNAKLLNRDQTEEWRGWMQVMFVWYHYFKAAEVYNAIRVFIAAYVWMTGYGNFTFFWKQGDYSLLRMLKMLFRLNFLVVLVCAATNNRYMLYYICPMHTFWFLSVYAMMYPFRHLNNSRLVMAVKFTIYVAAVAILYDVPGAAETAFEPFRFVLSYQGSLHEWIFRSRLDHYCTFFGMVCAYNYPTIEKLTAKLDKEYSSRIYALLSLFVKLAICAVLLLVTLIWYATVFRKEKFEYNKLHPYTSIIPLATYICLRNIFKWLRSRFVFMFAWLGKITLETYIAQLHIYMQSNAKSLIVYIPNYPLLNFILATAIYLLIAYQLFQLTCIINDYLFPRKAATMWKNLALASIWIGASYVISAFLVPTRTSLQTQIL